VAAGCGVTQFALSERNARSRFSSTCRST